MAKKGDSPVSEIPIRSNSILSPARHVKPCRKQPGPSGKAKYNIVTDSEPVPRGKGEKNPGRGVK